jgi:hypothetical protein
MNFDSMFDLLLRSFRVRSKALTRDQAQKATEHFSQCQWFAVELTYKNQPVRLVIATDRVPDEFKLTSGAAHQVGPAPGAPAP